MGRDIKMSLKKAIRNLREELDNLTLKELASKKERLEELAEIQQMVGDYVKMVNPKVMPFAI